MATRSIIGAAVLAGLVGAGAARVASLGSYGEDATTYTVDSSDAAFKVASSSTSKTLATLASSRVKVRGIEVDPRGVFELLGSDAGSPVVTCSIGTATAGHEGVYLAALNVSQVDGGASAPLLRNGRDLVVPDSSLAIVLYCSAADGTPFGTGAVTNLGSGKIWITVLTSTLPDGT